jgi:ubiquinone/menaquinone biosynthesis C-methylase UbiE
MQSEFWDGRAAKYDEEITRGEPDYVRMIAHTTAVLTETDVVLDLGCASGETCLDLAQRVSRVHGIDTSGRMIDLAVEKMQGRRITNVEFSKADAFDMRLEAESFSAVAALNVLHLVADLPGVLDRLHELLVPGGLLISQTPCLLERGPAFRTSVALAERSGVAPPILRLAYGDIATTMLRAGFQIVESELWDASEAVERVLARKLTTKTLTCDLCETTAQGETFEDWMAALRPHYAEAHADVMSDPERGPKEMKQWMVENRARFDAA